MFLTQEVKKETEHRALFLLTESLFGHGFPEFEGFLDIYPAKTPCITDGEIYIPYQLLKTINLIM